MQLSLFLLTLMGQCCFIKCLLYEYHYIEESMTWFEAQKVCKEKYTDLATLSNMTDMKELKKSTMREGTEAWIGLYKPKDGQRTWHWSLPGVEFHDNETKWGENTETGHENCGFMDKHFKWGDDPCETKQTFFLCYNESNPSQKFHLITKEKIWREAQRYCRANHTDLVSGLQQLEDEELEGLVNNTDKSAFFIGLFRDKWKWSDGSSFSFRHWDQDFKEDDESHTEGCAVMVETTRRWKNCSCNDRKHFFCYDDKVILIKKKMNWEDALYYCRDHHHDLVTITNLDEQRWVQEKAKKAKTPFVWTGLRYTCTLDFWFWVSDEEVRYKNWASGQDRDDCDMSGAMEKGGKHKWFKINDDKKYNFICSKS